MESHNTKKKHTDPLYRGEKKKKGWIQHNIQYIMLLLGIAGVSLPNLRLQGNAKKMKAVMKW